MSSYASSRKKKKERVKKKKGKKEALNVNFSKETQERLKQVYIELRLLYNARLVSSL